jgi:uncharacterized protein
MKLHLTQAAGKQLITGYSQDWISINNHVYPQSLIVLPDELLLDWTVAGFDSLNEGNFECLLVYRPEVVLLGTGSTHRFVRPSLIKALTAANTPVECMTTDAACRTYNILMAEGRKVAASLSFYKCTLETNIEGVMILKRFHSQIPYFNLS